jgi:dTDP-4-dehydrorhamnose reductase/SAM-dependent methyltransferase
LGQELKKLRPSIYAPNRGTLDVRNSCQVSEVLWGYCPDLVIHAAAVTNNKFVEKHPSEAIRTNIEGTVHVASCCLDLRCRLVYISTDYVYRGDRGNYQETDDLFPFNLYAWSKLGGEAAVRACRNHLIIRTSFGGDFQYREAFTDKWVSKTYVDDIAPMILDASLSTLIGVVNLGGPRKTVYDLVSERNPSVLPITISTSSYITPVDTSMDTSKWTSYKRDSMEDRSVDRCRVCGREGLEKYLDLGVVPLVNNLAKTREEALSPDLYPLQVAYCEGCSLSQTLLVVSPKKLYSTYLYRSSVSRTFVAHCKETALSYVEKYGENLSVLEIASNDGTLLCQFQKVAPGSTLLGIEPAANLAGLAEAQGIKTLNRFWGNPETTERVLETYPEGFDLIIGMNVFAHIDDVVSVLSEAKRCLSPRGRIAFEFPYLPRLILGNQFDTIYHEHLSYFLLRPLTVLAERVGLVVSDATQSPIHGGSIRVEFAPSGSPVSPSVGLLLSQEDAGGFYRTATYKEWAQSIHHLIQDVGDQLYTLKNHGRVIYGFGASAKGNILLNVTGTNTDLVSYIIDDTPEKIGKFSPGTGIPIVSRSLIRSVPPSYVLLLAWNFGTEIKSGLRDYADAGGKFITPVPTFVID